MIEAISPDKIHLILPFKVSQMAVLMAHQFGMSPTEAVMEIYRSNTYRELENEQTKLWHLGPVALLEHYTEHH